MNLVRGQGTQYCNQMNNANALIRNTYKEMTFKKAAYVFQEASSLLTCSLQIKQIKEKMALKNSSWNLVEHLVLGDRQLQ